VTVKDATLLHDLDALVDPSSRGDPTSPPKACRLLITADCEGSNGYRVRRWWLLLQELVDELQMTIQVCHFPPGTSKWN
jgi:hypothetical protein